MSIYLHKHHVVPKHAGGTNMPSKENRILETVALR